MDHTLQTKTKISLMYNTHELSLDRQKQAFDEAKKVDKVVQGPIKGCQICRCGRFGTMWMKPMHFCLDSKLTLHVVDS
jgi:hypothetical protein